MFSLLDILAHLHHIEIKFLPLQNHTKKLVEQSAFKAFEVWWNKEITDLNQKSAEKPVSPDSNQQEDAKDNGNEDA